MSVWFFVAVFVAFLAGVAVERFSHFRMLAVICADLIVLVDSLTQSQDEADWWKGEGVEDENDDDEDDADTDGQFH